MSEKHHGKGDRVAQIRRVRDHLNREIEATSGKACSTRSAGIGTAVRSCSPGVEGRIEG